MISSPSRHFSLLASTYRLCLCVVCMVCAALSISGCDVPPPAAKHDFDTPRYEWGKVKGRTITIRGNVRDLQRPFFIKSFQLYQARTSNKIVIEALTQSDLVRNLTETFIAHTEKKPDILLSFGGANIERWFPEENFYDFTTAQWIDDVNDTALTQAIYNGKVYGLPFGEVSTAGMLYNKTLFEKYGLDVPHTQSEFMDLCEALLQNGITPLYLPYAEINMMMYQIPMDSILRNPKTLSKVNAGELDYIDMPQMRAVVAWYKEMADRGYLGKNYRYNTWEGMSPALSSGQYAMMICWDTWLYANFSGNPADFGLMPAFMGVPDAGTFEGPNLSLLVVSKHSPELEAALDFITFLADPHIYNEVFDGLHTAPVFKNQAGHLATPQFLEAEARVEALLHDSTAWLRVRGFSQLDARYIQAHMREAQYSIEDCLRDMDATRKRRVRGMH